MAKLYGEIASSALMTFDKSFARSNGQPLDSTEVFYSLSAAETYAAGDVAYIGQKIVVVETVDDVTTVTHYGIEPDASLKELGALPIGDGVTVEVVNGKIQLVGLSGKGSGTYQPFLVNGKIEWREPSAVTVEGLDGRLETLEDTVGTVATDDAEATGLIKSVSDLEDIVGKPAEGDVEATGLVKDVADNADAISALEGIVGKPAEGETAATGLVKDVADINTKIGTVADGKTVVEMIEDAQEAATYDDTQVKADIKANADAIDVLNGTGDGSVDKKITDAFNDFSTKVTDDAVVNSYKELIDWAKEHGSDAAEMAGAITKLQNILAGIGGTDEKATVVAYVADAIDALKIGDYAKAQDLTDLAARVLAMENKVDAWDAAEQNAKDHADDLNEAMDIRVKAIEDIEPEKNVINSADGTNFEVDTNRQLKLKDIPIEKVTDLQDELDSKVDAETGKRLMTDAEGTKLEGIESGAQVNAIDAVDTTEFDLGTNKTLTIKKIAMGKIDLLTEEFAKKANTGTTLAEYGIEDAYDKTAVDNAIKEVTDDLATVSGNADSANSKIDEYVTSNNTRVQTIEDKLKDIESGAQVNKIESVKLNGTALEITEKAVNIPLGAGLKASAEVTIAADGTLGIGTMNVNKLVQTDGEVLILNCGDSSK